MLQLQGWSLFYIRARGLTRSIQTDPSIHPHRSPPLVHLPLSVLSSESSSELTPWRHIELNLSSLIPLFQSLARRYEEKEEKGTGSRKKRKTEIELPNGGFRSVSYVRIYANCRIRRIWLVSFHYLAYLFMFRANFTSSLLKGRKPWKVWAEASEMSGHYTPLRTFHPCNPIHATGEARPIQIYICTKNL